MSSPQTDAALEAAATSRRLASQAYGIGIPAMQTEAGALGQALSMGAEPGYLQSAYTGARGMAREGAAEAGTASLQASQAQKKGYLEGGAVGMAAPPADIGAQLAQALYGPRVQEAAGQLGQLDKLFGFGLGQAQQTGSGALAATENQLRDIGMMRPYNMGYAGILGALNLGGSIYGTFGQQGANPYGPINAGQGWNVGGLSGIGGT